MRSGSVIFTTKHPRYLAVFLVLIVLALALLVCGCCVTAEVNKNGWNWGNCAGSPEQDNAIRIICIFLMGIMLFAYAVLPGLFRLYSDSYVSWYAISGCAALVAFVLETLKHSGVFWDLSVDSGSVLLYPFHHLSRLAMILISFGAAMHQCKPQPGLWVRRLSTAAVIVLSVVAATASICCPKGTGAVILIVCVGAIAALSLGILCRGVWGSGYAALIPAIGNLAMFTGFFFADLSVGTQGWFVHQLVLPLCMLIMLGCWAVMVSGKQKLQIATLEKALAAEQGTARTQAAFLASQIQPHFLYNTLTTIQELCYTNPLQAADTVVRFSNYLRQNIDFMEYKDKIPFSVEMEHIENYLDIQRARFGDAIKFVKEIDFEAFELPPLTVQPLIENAISHGIRKRNGQGTVTLKVQKSNGHVFISVIDDGTGFDVNAVHSRSLENIRCRIEGAMDGVVQIDSRPPKGTTVAIKFPYKEAVVYADHNS